MDIGVDVDAGRVKKGIAFQTLRDVGDPVELAQRYEAEGADEVVGQIEEGAPEYLRPARFDAILSLLFPAMARGLANGKGRVI